MSMKNFIQYLTEGTKVYEFKVKFANIDPTDKIDVIEGALKAFGDVTVGKPKSLPITESNIDFPAQKAPQVWVMEVTLQYPCTDDQLRACLAEHAGVPQGAVRVIPKNHPEELWRNNEGELREYVQGESVLDKPYEDNPEGKAAGKKYAEAGSLLRELSTPVVETAGEEMNPEGSKGKTTNELPQGTSSPVGSNKNKIPSPVKGQR